jgi:hypothetical protein
VPCPALAKASHVPCPALAKASGMMSTAVMVGEMTATDWANNVGNPSALTRKPGIFLVDGSDEVVLPMVIGVELLVLPLGNALVQSWRRSTGRRG